MLVAFGDLRGVGVKICEKSRTNMAYICRHAFVAREAHCIRHIFLGVWWAPYLSPDQFKGHTVREGATRAHPNKWGGDPGARRNSNT